MKALFDQVSARCSKLVTRSYSTSFSLGIYCLNKKLHHPIYSIYGFVRLADEIVDSFHDYDKPQLLMRFREDTWKAIEEGISLNPILNSFQQAVNHYKIERELIHCFLKSMEMDLYKMSYNSQTYKEYILGSAEVVGLMCLRIFTHERPELYEWLKPAAMSLGSAFQKVNFLRDLKEDSEHLGRLYFPGLDLNNFTEEQKHRIALEIEQEFSAALAGIKQLPASSKFGVYVAYVYYRDLFRKIKALPGKQILKSRVRIPNYQKIGLLAGSYVRHSMKMI